MTTSKVNLTEGSGSKIVATYSLTEDAVTKELQRIVDSDSSGNEIEAITVGQDTAAASLPVVLATDDYVAASTQVDDAAFTPGTSRVMVIGAEADEGSPDSVDEGDAGALRMTLARGMHVNLRNAAGTEIAAVVLGQDVMAASVPVAIASNQSAVPVSGTITAVTAITNVVHVDDNSASLTVDNADITATATVAGTTSGTKVVTDANGTLQQYLRGLVTQGVNFCAGEYETVAASATDQILGPTGATGDYLEAVLIVPGTAAAGAVSIKDGNGSSISIFAGGGTTALADLAPIYVPLGMICVNGTTPGWKVTTGTNVTAIGIGNFT